MEFEWTAQALAYLIASFFLAGLIPNVLRDGKTPATRPMLIMLLVQLAWVLFEGLSLMATGVDTKFRLTMLAYPSLVGLVPVMILLTIRMRNPNQHVSTMTNLALFGIPVLAVGIVFLVPMPNLIFHAVTLELFGGVPRLVMNRGPLSVISIGHTASLAIFLLVTLWARSRKLYGSFRSGHESVLIGMTISFLAVVLHVLHFNPLPYVDSLPVGSVISATFLIWGTRKAGSLGLIGIGPRLLIDALEDGVLVVDANRTLVDLNRYAAHILKVKHLSVVGKPIEDGLKDYPDMLALLRRASSGPLPERWFQTAEIVVDGECRTFDLSVSVPYDSDGDTAWRVLILRDGTDRRRAQEGLERETSYVHLIQEVSVSANEAASVDEAIASGVELIRRRLGLALGWVYRPDDGDSPDFVMNPEPLIALEEEHPGFADIEKLRRIPSGWGLPGRAWESRVTEVSCDLDDGSGDDDRQISAALGLSSILAIPISIQSEVPLVMIFGSTDEIEAGSEMAGVLSHLGVLLGRVIERKRSEARIRDLAYYDSLTGLPNRQLFRQRLELSLKSACRSGKKVALLFIDLDGFKRINDTLGHPAGDDLLTQVAKRFSMSLRSKDLVLRLGADRAAEANSISRFGGDEFTVLLGDIESPEGAVIVARRLMSSLVPPFGVSGKEVFTAASAGIAIYPDDGDNADILFQNADVAMYEAKKLGSGGFQFYAEEMNRESLRRLSLESCIRYALERGAFCVHYQPQFDAVSGEIVGVEALARLFDPVEGTIPPSEFIPIAEQAGLIGLLGNWVLGMACAQNREWQYRGFRPIRVAVNVSGYQIRNHGIVEQVARTLVGTELDPRWLELEITESAIQSDDPVTRESLYELSKLGLNLALDDFGTGSSSLTHLRRFPIDQVKIDQVFIRGVTENEDDAALTSAIIAMAHGLRQTVVAEGVETQEQLDFLKQAGCDVIQGFLLGKPVPPEEIEQFLIREKTDDEV